MELVRKTLGEKNITEKILDVLIDFDSDIRVYNNAIDDYNTLGGIDKIAEIMDWDESQKENWKLRIMQVYSIR